MFNFRNLHRDERGQTALEAAIILIAFIVVASVFAFAVLSAGSESTERGQEAIYSGLEEVQSSLVVKGAVIAQASGTTVDTVSFTVALASTGLPMDLTVPDDGGDDVLTGDDDLKNSVVIGFRDGSVFANEMNWTVSWIGDNDGDDLLESGELAEIAVDVSQYIDKVTDPANPALAAFAANELLGANSEFTIEIKPPTGAVFQIQRTTPAAIEKVMELR